MTDITTVAELEKHYGTPSAAATVKEIDYISPEYRAYIEASPFVILATSGPEGMDCSPRGDRRGTLVRIVDERTVMLPDRRGNNRIDSLRNIVRDPRVALLFLVPGHGNTLRINGRARITVDNDLLASFAVEGKAPRSVTVFTVDSIYFQCSRAILRSELWNAAQHITAADLPTPGDILAALTDNQVGGASYDKEWPERARQSMW